MPVHATVKAPETQLYQQSFSIVACANSDGALREECLQHCSRIMSCTAILVADGEDHTPPYP